jgi:hypothetical protein
MSGINLFSVVCGFLAMTVAAGVGLAQGYEGMSLARPWPHLLALAVLVEMLVMRWIGPAPGLLVMVLLSPLAKRWPRVELLQAGLFVLFIPATAVGLALFLLWRVIRLAAH